MSSSKGVSRRQGACKENGEAWVWFYMNHEEAMIRS